ncbi:MAG: L-serine ammonia-lyase, iron-sulfur-dependent subunit beta [Bacteroidota bacterium]
MSERSSIFDMIGPIMIGPSSSHTAGVVRIGRVARRVLGTSPQKAQVTFYNSFAHTYEGHGSDRAVVAGLLDMKTDDARIREAFVHAEKAKLAYEFRAIANDSTQHPNSVRIKMSAGDRQVEVLGISRGGGLIAIRELDKFACNFSAQAKTIIFTAQDKPGSIAFITDVISQDECNIATMTVDRKGKHDIAKLVLEMDSRLRPITLDYLSQLPWVKEVCYIPDIDL